MQSKRIFLILLAIISPFLIKAQTKGCTDYRAKNYNPLATINDGSCVYEKTNFKATEVQASLPAVLLENSGMIFMNGLFWFINDSGALPEFYSYDSASNAVKQSIRLKNARNIDWEAITDNSDYIFIGDFGNNEGKRKDLTIYKIVKKDIPSSGSKSVVYDSITFTYPDQTDFNSGNQNHDFDCEAMIVAQDSIYLFSKNWKNQKTKLYRLPSIPGNYIAELIDSYNIDGLITDAAIDTQTRNIFLLGYKNYQPFFWLLFDYHNNNFFSGNKRRFEMPGHYLFQTESAYFLNPKTVYFSSEKTPLTANRLFRAEINSYVVKKTSSVNEIDNKRLKIYPNLAKTELLLELPDDVISPCEVRIYDSMGRQLQIFQQLKTQNGNQLRINIKPLNNGIYFMALTDLNKNVFRIKFLVTGK